MQFVVALVYVLCEQYRDWLQEQYLMHHDNIFKSIVHNSYQHTMMMMMPNMECTELVLEIDTLISCK